VEGLMNLSDHSGDVVVGEVREETFDELLLVHS